MRKLERRAWFCVIICLVFLLGIGYFLYCYVKDGSSWYLQKSNRHLYTSEGELVSGTITDRNGTVLSEVTDGVRTYSEDKTLRTALLHVIGDREGKIGSSVLYNAADYFISYDAVEGANALSEEGNTLVLSLDAEAEKTAYEAMDGLVGTVGVYNYKTGEILCLVSTPGYDPEAVPEDLETSETYSGAYVNRFLKSRFTPGSTMKTVLLSAVLELYPELAEETFTCNGSVTIGGNTMNCTKAHGTVTLKEAFAQSCNCVFGELAVKVGGVKLQEYIRKAGLTSSVDVEGLTSTEKGSFELVTISDFQLSYAGIGLYHDLVNPCTLMLYYGAIANGGTAALPTVISSVTSPGGSVLFTHTAEFTGQLVESETAALLTEYLENNVRTVYDSSRFPSVTIGAKSGTVEQKTGLSNCWFCGYVRDESYPYAFVVYLENAGSGNRVAGGVAAAVLNSLIPAD